MKYINWDNIQDFAFVNTDTLVGKPKGIAVNFHGYTDATMFDKSNDFAKRLGENGIVFVFPYYSVWAWLSKSSCEYINEVLDVVYEHYGFDENTPLVTAGGSMGGMTSIMYHSFGKRNRVACAADCPVTDFECMLGDREKKRAIHSAFILEDKPLEDCVRDLSPMNSVQNMPHIPYKLVFGGNDARITKHGLIFSEKMKSAGYDIEYHVVDGMAHCALASYEKDFTDYVDFIVKHING